jgi:putative ABC transport system permease protein
MTSRNLFFLYRQRVRAHPLQELIALVGIAVGVALVFAVQVANTSVAGSVQQLMRGLTGRAELQVTARDAHGFDAGLTERIGRVRGVRGVAPIVDLQINLRGRRATRAATLVGGDQRLVGMGGGLLRSFASPSLIQLQAVALPRALAHAIGAGLGDRMTVEVGALAHTVPVATVLGRDQIGALAESPVLLAPLPYAQQLAGLGKRVTRVLVDVRPGHIAQVRRAIERIAGTRLNVVDAGSEARLLHQATAPNDQSTALFASISAMVGLLFAFNAMLLTVPERRRFLADLRLEGLGDLTVVRLVWFDAVVLGLASSAVGLLLGELLSTRVFHAVPGYLSYAFTVGDQRIVTTQTVLIAVAGGLGATLLAALRPLSDLFSRRPLDDVYREDDERGEDALVHRGWLPLGAALLVGAATLVLLLAPRITIVGIGLLVAAMLLLMPGGLAVVVRTLDRLSHRLRSAVVVVAVGELRAMTTRSVALAATGALAVFGSVAVEGAHFDLQRGLDRDAHAFNARADVWITASGPQNELATTRFEPPPAAATLARLPGVRAVRTYRGAFLDVGDRRAWVVAPPRTDPTPILPSELVAGDFATATRRLRGRGWVAVTRALADEHHLHIGDPVTLPTPRPTRLRVAAELTNLGWSSGAIVLNADDFAHAWASSDVSALQLLVEPDASSTAIATRARRALQSTAGLMVETAAQREQRFRHSTRQGLSRLTQIATLVLIAAALALAAAMGGVVWNRRPRLAALKLSGFSDGDVWRTLVLEGAIVLSVGCSIGALFGLYGQLMLTRWLANATDFPTSYATAGWLALSTFAAVTVVAVAIAAVPGFLAARVPPTANLQGD